MTILKDAKVEDQIEDSLGNKGVVYYINQTLGLYNVKFEGGGSNSYNAAGYGFNNELQLIEGHLTSCIPAKEPTVLQTLPVVATKKYAKYSDTDVNGNIQILTPRGWDVCHWATGYSMAVQLFAFQVCLNGNACLLVSAFAATSTYC